MVGSLRALDAFPEDPGLASICVRQHTAARNSRRAPEAFFCLHAHKQPRHTYKYTQTKNKAFRKKLAGEVPSLRQELVNESMPRVIRESREVFDLPTSPMTLGDTVCPAPVSLLGFGLAWSYRDFIHVVGLHMHFPHSIQYIMFPCDHPLSQALRLFLPSCAMIPELQEGDCSFCVPFRVHHSATSFSLCLGQWRSLYWPPSTANTAYTHRKNTPWLEATPKLHVTVVNSLRHCTQKSPGIKNSLA